MKTEINDILVKLEHAANLYYNTDQVSMTDEEFDELKEKYEKLSGKKFFVGSSPIVTNRIAVSHSYKNLAGTLDKVNTLEQLRQWMVSKKVTSKDTEASLKFDGHSIIIEFDENGKIYKALTRGRDGEGKDLTGFFKILLNDFSINLVLGKKFAIAFEAVISWKNLDLLNEEFSLNYKSPRSAISGIIKEDGIPLAKYLQLVPLKFHFHESSKMKITRKQELEYLSLIAETHEIFYELFTIDQYGLSIEEVYESFSSIEKFNVFMVDGLVIEILDSAKRKELGYSDDRPNFAVALKFPYQTKSTKLVDVEWYTEGNQSIYTPVAVIEPVMLNGFTYTRVSLANYSRFLSMKLRVGSKLAFSLRNEVLGYVEKMQDEPSSTKGKRLLPPSKCYECNESLYTDDVFLFCINSSCKLSRIGEIQNFAEKMGIKGIKREILDKLFEEGVVTSIQDLVLIDKKKAEIESIAGFGKKSASIIINSVRSSLFERKVYDFEVLGSLNIELVSRGRAKVIFRDSDILIKDLLEIDKAMIKKLSKIDSIKEAIINSLEEGLKEKRELFEFLLRTLPIINFKETITVKEKGESLSFCVTGNLKSMGRDEFKFELEKLGHKMVSSVTKKTSYLVTNDVSSGTVKNKQAQTLNIPIINEEQALKILGLENKGSFEVVKIEDVF